MLWAMRELINTGRSSSRALAAGRVLSATLNQPSFCPTSLTVSRGLSSDSSATPAEDALVSDALQHSSSTSAGDLAEALGSTSSSLGSCLDPLSTLGSFAAQPLEPMSQMLSPVVLGCSIWEIAHSATGLPWWASIPLTTIALRTALLPLTLKAKSAGLNFVLAQHATQTATNLVDHWKQQQQQEAGQQPNSSNSSKSSNSSSSSSSALGRQLFGADGEDQLKRPSRWRLSRMYYRYYRKQHGTTSLWWWTGNIAVQLNLFLALSLALKQMAATQWPGFTDQGLGWIADLTHPAVVWAGLKASYCPYGTAGLLLPLGLVYMYKRTVELSPLAERSTTAFLLLSCGVVPYFVISSTAVPQATLLYWASNSAFFYGLQWALQQPKIVTALKLPALMLPPPKRTKEARERAELEAVAAQQLVCGSEDDGFLRYLAASYLSRGMHQQAIQCLERLTVLAPGDAAAFHALGTTAAELQRWPVSATAFERAAELHAVAVEREESVQSMLLAGKQWLNATAEARAKQKQQGKGQAAANGPAAAAGATQAAAEAGTADKAVAAAEVQPGKQQEYINKALAVLQEAVSLQPDTAVEGWYLLAMAHAADGSWEPSFSAASTFWSLSCRAAEDDQTAKINAAAKLLPVLNNLCKQQRKLNDLQSLLTISQLAVEVARCGWDRQTEEQLRDTLSAAAQAASQQGKAALSQEFRELLQQLPVGTSGVLRQRQAKK